VRSDERNLPSQTRRFRWVSGGLRGGNEPAGDVRAADLQEETVKPLGDVLSVAPPSVFTGSDEDGGDQRTSQRAERAIRQSARCASV
jgi:hypothetical protein